MTLELLPRHDVDKIRANFVDLGHVGVSRCYDPELAAPAAAELSLQLMKQEFRSLGHLVGKFADYKPPVDSSMGELLSQVRTNVNHLGDDLWPDRDLFLQHHEMTPEKKGNRHVDSGNIFGFVAIMTLQGNSLLRIFEDGDVHGDYVIEPGARKRSG